ncbi:cyclin-like protein [Dioszegia hungarica]|uniref:Cyclin-like protein n=1 Tax=Dioszegia hungarica TaxID=4972 RepID=A0AA38LTH7_9TREE|nr:cyclin-like protein [Dioszegia hungarica]KAI9632506.1 cyclin-like protein [Dioszegia hungarica]
MNAAFTPRLSTSTSTTASSSTGYDGAASASSPHVQKYRPYFSAREIERLSAKQRGKLSVAREERGRQQACGFIDAVGVRCGFPRGTIATAQMLYIRFHLYFPYKDHNYMLTTRDVSLATLYVSSKLHDTLKKPRDIILASYPLRYPHLIAQRKGGVLDPALVDVAALEAERGRVLGIERLVLESVCFRFAVGGGLGWVVKIAKRLKMSKETTMAAWRTAVDCYRTPVSLSYPAHTIALGSIYACALLTLAEPRPHDQEELPSASGATPDNSPDQTWRRLAAIMGTAGSWEQDMHASAAEVNAIAQSTLDLHITILSTPPSDPQHALTPSPTSPRDAPSAPSDPSASTSASAAIRSSIANTAFRLPAYWTVQTLTEMKVYLRERAPVGPGDGDGMEVDGAPEWGDEGGEMGVIEAQEKEEERKRRRGMNEGTTRFVWDHGVAV